MLCGEVVDSDVAVQAACGAVVDSGVVLGVVGSFAVVRGGGVDPGFVSRCRVVDLGVVACNGGRHLQFT